MGKLKKVIHHRDMTEWLTNYTKIKPKSAIYLENNCRKWVQGQGTVGFLSNFLYTYYDCCYVYVVKPVRFAVSLQFRVFLLDMGMGYEINMGFFFIFRKLYFQHLYAQHYAPLPDRQASHGEKLTCIFASIIVNLLYVHIKPNTIIVTGLALQHRIIYTSTRQ